MSAKGGTHDGDAVFLPNEVKMNLILPEIEQKISLGGPEAFFKFITALGEVPSGNELSIQLKGVYVCLCVCMCLSVCVCVFVCMRMCLRVVCVYVCVHVCVYVCVHVCVYVYLCVFVSVCMHVCLLVYACCVHLSMCVLYMHA